MILILSFLSVKTTKSLLPAFVLPRANHLLSTPECFISSATINGSLKKISSDSEFATPCFPGFFERLPSSHWNPVMPVKRSMTLCILLKYTQRWGKGQVMLLKKRFAGCSRKPVFGIQEGFFPGRLSECFQVPWGRRSVNKKDIPSGKGGCLQHGSKSHDCFRCFFYRINFLTSQAVLSRHNRCRLKSRRIGKYVRFVHCTRNCTTVNRRSELMAT